MFLTCISWLQQHDTLRYNVHYTRRGWRGATGSRWRREWRCQPCGKTNNLIQSNYLSYLVSYLVTYPKYLAKSKSMITCIFTWSRGSEYRTPRRSGRRASRRGRRGASRRRGITFRASHGFVWFRHCNNCCSTVMYVYKLECITLSLDVHIIPLSIIHYKFTVCSIIWDRNTLTNVCVCKFTDIQYSIIVLWFLSLLTMYQYA